MAIYWLLMRLLQLIALVLLLVGFAARPTVATAVTDGHFLDRATLSTMFHLPHPKIIVVATLEHGLDMGSAHCQPVKCVAGVLPSTTAPLPRQQATPVAVLPLPRASFRLGYTQLRPPQSVAPLRA